MPDYCATTRFDQGIRRTLAWFQADPARQLVDEAENAVWDKIIDAYEKGLTLPCRASGNTLLSCSALAVVS